MKSRAVGKVLEIGGKKKWSKSVTVEPVMFFYMMAFMITSVVEQAFFVNKACLVNFRLKPEICDHLNETEHKELNNQIQVTVSTFHQWNGIAGHVVPILLAFFLGAWSDKRGRKGVMLSGLIGKFIYSFMVIMISLQDSWPLEYVIYMATIPSALTGADVAIFAAAFSYISDVTTLKDRTFRVGILDVCYLSTMPIGVALGSYLFNKVFDHSYSIMFSINASLLAVAILYTVFHLEWHTTSRQQSMAQAGVKNFVTDFFDKKHAMHSFQVLAKKRLGHRRTYLILTMISMSLYTFQRDEKPMLYLYMVKVFGWDTIIYSNFKTFQSLTYVIMMLLGIPLMSKLFKWKDTVIVMIGALSHATGRIFFATAKVSSLFYVGASFASLGPCVAPVLRSITSKAVQLEERGKVFAMLSVCDNAVTLFSATLYSQLYNATIHTNFPTAIFYLTMSTQLAVFLFALIIHISLGSDLMEGQGATATESSFQSSQSNLKIETVDSES